MSSTPPLTHTLRLLHRLRSFAAVNAAVILTASVAAAIVLAASTPRTAQGVAVALTAGDPVDIAQGISITPAPGWTLGTRGPDRVALHNGDTSAEMRVTVKPAGGTDVVAVLQGDINQYSASAGLSSVQN